MARRILIRGLEAGSAYLAYLLREGGVEVDILTRSPTDPLLDVPPFEPFFTLDFIKDVLAVKIVDTPRGSYDAVVDSCDVDLRPLRKALEGDKPTYVVGDSWLSASLSLYRSLPVPDVDIDLPVEKSGQFVELSIRYKPYAGGDYTLCGSLRDGWGGCLYTPMRTLERIYIAADIYAMLANREAPRRNIRLEYAVGRDRAYVAMGCRPEGKGSRINMGEIQVWAYGGGYLLISGRPEDLPWALSMYNLARVLDMAPLYDISHRGRGAINMASLPLLFREARQT